MTFASSAFANSAFQTDSEDSQLGGGGRSRGHGGKRDEPSYEDWQARVEYREALQVKPPVPVVLKPIAKAVREIVVPVPEYVGPSIDHVDYPDPLRYFREQRTRAIAVFDAERLRLELEMMQDEEDVELLLLF